MALTESKVQAMRTFVANSMNQADLWPRLSGSNPIDGTENGYVSSAKSANDSPAAHGRSRPIYLWNPSGFNPLTYLSELLRKRADLARFVLHKIIWSNVFGRADRRGFVTLKAAYLREFFPDSGVYSRVMKGLIDGGAIICDGQYIEGEKCLGYKLSPEYSTMRQRRIQVTDRSE